MANEYADDQQCVEQILGGDEAAFERLFHDSFPRLYRFALYRVDGDTDLAKDMAQQTLCHAMNKLDTYRAESSLQTWLSQICWSQITAHFRKQNRRQRKVVPMHALSTDAATVEQTIEDSGQQPDQHIESGQTHQLLHQALDELPEDYALILEMKYIDDESVSTIAARLSSSETSIQSKLARARTALRKQLEQPQYRSLLSALDPAESSTGRSPS